MKMSYIEQNFQCFLGFCHYNPSLPQPHPTSQPTFPKKGIYQKDRCLSIPLWFVNSRLLFWIGSLNKNTKNLNSLESYSCSLGWVLVKSVNPDYLQLSLIQPSRQQTTWELKERKKESVVSKAGTARSFHTSPGGRQCILKFCPWGWLWGGTDTVVQ